MFFKRLNGKCQIKPFMRVFAVLAILTAVNLIPSNSNTAIAKSTPEAASISEDKTERVESLIERLGVKDKDVREATVEALVKIGEPAVEPLIKALGDGKLNGNVRTAAAWALGNIGDTKAVEPLIKVLGDRDVRTTAAWALGKIGDRRAIEPLIKALRPIYLGYNPGSEAAAEALGKIGEPAVEPLIKAALVTGYLPDRKAITNALVKIGEPAIEPLIKVLGDGKGNVRSLAAEALGSIGDTKAVEPLIKVLGDEDKDVRKAAAVALGKIGEPAVELLIKELGDKDRDVHRAAVEALGKIGEPAVEPLIKALGDKDVYVSTGAAQALGEIGDTKAVEPLIKALGDGKGSFRSFAMALGKIGDKKAIEPLIKALGDRNLNVRAAAAEALGNIGDTKAVEPLIKLLGDGYPSVVPAAAAEALGKIGDAKAVEPLINALGTKQQIFVFNRFLPVRKATAEALGNIGEPAIESLIKRLGDKNRYYVRLFAARALGKIGEPAVEPLIKLLGDGHVDVRTAAVDELVKLGWKPVSQEEKIKFNIATRNWNELVKTGKPAVGPLIKVLWGRPPVAQALVKIGEPAIEPLIKALGDRNMYRRKAVVEVLVKLGWKPVSQEEKIKFNIATQKWNELVKIGTPAVKPLIKLLGDNNSDVRKAAAEALGKIGEPAVKPLIKLMGDRKWIVREEAAEALSKIGEPAVELLIKELGDRKWSVRSAAAEALGEIGDTKAVEPLVRLLEDNYEDVLDAAADALVKIGEPAVEPLIKAFGDRTLNVNDRAFAARVLAKIGEPAVEPLIKALGDRDISWFAFKALGEIGDTKATEPLLQVLGDEDNYNRDSAAWALVKLGWEPVSLKNGKKLNKATQKWIELVKTGKPAVEPLIKALGDVYPSVRKAAAEALGNIGDTKAVESLIKVLGDGYPSVRKTAAEALGEIGDANAAEPLIKGLSDKEWYVRKAAAEALMKLGWKPVSQEEKIEFNIAVQNYNELAKTGKPAIEPLLKKLGDKYGHVRAAAASALGKIGDVNTIAPLIKALEDDIDVRKAAAVALAEIGKPAVEPLIKVLGDEDKYVRAAAARTIGNIGDIKAVEPLIKVLGDKCWYVRKAAARALGDIGDTKAVEPLIKALCDKDKDVRKAAAEALEKLNYKLRIHEKYIIPFIKIHTGWSIFLAISSLTILGVGTILLIRKKLRK